jgi:hypothetical protein
MSSFSGPSRTERYLHRLELHLAALADNAARRAILATESDKWEERYARFIASEGDSIRSGAGADQPSAFDFVDTIAALDALRVRYAEGTAA